MKAFTSLKQSKKLAKILPLESADMGWNVFVDGTTRILPINDWDLVKDGSGNVKFYHAWSLAALLSLMPRIEYLKPFIDLSPKLDSEEVAIYYHSEDSPYIVKDNLVDACYEMITTLHEQNIL